MHPEQWCEAAAVGVGEEVTPRGVVEGVLQHQGIDVDQRSLQDPQGQYEELLLVAAVGLDVAALAVGEDAVRAVLGLDDVQAFLDLALQVAQAQVARDEDRLLRAADLEHRRVGGV